MLDDDLMLMLKCSGLSDKERNVRELEERIKSDAVCLPGGIIVANSFLNHQVDSVLMRKIGEEFAARFDKAKPTKILTAETSGIVPALATAFVLGIPLVFARKQKPNTMFQEPYVVTAPSHTKGGEVSLYVAREFLSEQDRVLIVDDFLATAETLVALCKIVDQSKAELVGIAAIVEKCYQNGREKLKDINVPIVTLAKIEKVEDGKVVFATAAV
jgi:xanthine phosphoribosyltransferase